MGSSSGYHEARRPVSLTSRRPALLRSAYQPLLRQQGNMYENRLYAGHESAGAAGIEPSRENDTSATLSEQKPGTNHTPERGCEELIDTFLTQSGQNHDTFLHFASGLLQHVGLSIWGEHMDRLRISWKSKEDTVAWAWRGRATRGASERVPTEAAPGDTAAFRRGPGRSRCGPLSRRRPGCRGGPGRGGVRVGGRSWRPRWRR